MSHDYLSSNANSPQSEQPPLQRIPLSERTPRGTSNDSDRNEGGVTVTPHTGQISKLRFTNDTDIAGLTTQKEDNLVANAEENIAVHKYESLANSGEFTTVEVSLDLPGITAPVSKFSRTSKLVSRVRQRRAQDQEQEKNTRRAKHKSILRLLSSNGWIPNQHGAYMMMLIPPITGMILSGLDWKQILFLAVWICGYFTFFSFSRWVKSGGKEKYFPPLRTYGILSALLASLSIALMPPLSSWVIPFIPIVGILVFETYKHREHNLPARSIAVIATGLAGLISYDIGVNFWHPYHISLWIGYEQTQLEPIWSSNSAHTLVGWDWALMVMFYLTIYFWSTILFVKTLARGKNSFSHYLFSVAAHSAILMLMGAFSVAKWIPLSAVLVWFILSLLSIAVPLWNKHSQSPLSLRQIGMVELIICLIVVSAIFT